MGKNNLSYRKFLPKIPNNERESLLVKNTFICFMDLETDSELTAIQKLFGTGLIVSRKSKESIIMDDHNENDACPSTQVIF